MVTGTLIQAICFLGPERRGGVELSVGWDWDVDDIMIDMDWAQS